MNVRRLIILSVLWVAVLSSCTQPEVKQTEDVRRIEQIDRFIMDLRAYAGTENFDAFDSVYPADRRMEIPEIKKALVGLQSPKLDLVIDRISLNNDKAEVTLHWEYRWRRPSETEPTVKRGNAVFQVEGAETLRVVEISGDNPFSAPLAVQAPPE